MLFNFRFPHAGGGFFSRVLWYGLTRNLGSLLLCLTQGNRIQFPSVTSYGIRVGVLTHYDLWLGLEISGPESILLYLETAEATDELYDACRTIASFSPYSSVPTGTKTSDQVIWVSTPERWERFLRSFLAISNSAGLYPLASGVERYDNKAQ